MDESENRATLMTLHSAKGLEFPKVYLVGMEDGLFPSMMSITADDKSEIEEERRLCYVGITRAREELVMTSARQRMVNGETRYSKPSQFVEELPASAVEFDRLEPALSGYGGFGGGGGNAGASGRKTDAYADDSLPWNQGGMKARGKGIRQQPQPLCFPEYRSGRVGSRVETGLWESIYRAEAVVFGLRTRRPGFPHQVRPGNREVCGGRSQGL